MWISWTIENEHPREWLNPVSSRAQAWEQDSFLYKHLIQDYIFGAVSWYWPNWRRSVLDIHGQIDSPNAWKTRERRFTRTYDADAKLQPCTMTLIILERGKRKNPTATAYRSKMECSIAHARSSWHMQRHSWFGAILKWRLHRGGGYPLRMK